MPRLAPAQTVLGRYTVHAFVGEGPLGEVYDVVDGQSGAHYALKLYPPALAGTPVWQAFVGGVQRMAAAPGLARAFDGGVDPSTGTPYVLSELLSIPSLAAQVPKGRITPPAVGQLLKSLASAVAHAHQVGLAHGAIHPSNVFAMEGQGAPQVRATDLGSAALRAAAPPPSGPVRLGWVAPEQWSGSAPTPASDVWAMGVLAFYALTAKSPFLSTKGDAPDANAVWAEVSAPLPPASQRAADLGVGLHESMNPWFARALSPSPHDRFPSAVEAADAFVAVAPNMGLGGTFLLENASTNAKLAAAQVAWAATQAIPQYAPDVTGEAPVPPLPLGPPARALPTPAPFQPPPGAIPTPPPMSALPVSQMSVPAVGVSAPLPSVPPPAKKKTNVALIVIPVVLLGLIIVGVAVAFLVFAKSDAKSDQATDPPSASAAPPGSETPAAEEPPPPAASAEPPPAAASSSAAVAAKPPPPVVKGPMPTKPVTKPTVGGNVGIRQKGK